MRIAATVQTIADAISSVSPSLSPSQQARLGLLRLMPNYTKVQKLGPWEQAYNSVPDSDTQVDLDHLLGALFEFGSSNLYGAFDPAESAQLYGQLTEHLQRVGIAYPALGKFTGF